MPKRRQTYEDIARIEDEKVAQGREAEGFVRVAATVSTELEHIVQLHFTSEEMARIGKRAKAKGMQVGQYLRAAVLGPTQTENSD